MKIIDHNFRPKKTETSFGTFGCQMVEVDKDILKKIEKVSKDIANEFEISVDEAVKLLKKALRIYS